MRVFSRLVMFAMAAALFAAVPSAAPAPEQAKPERPTVALLDFDYGSVDNWWGGNVDIGKGIADLIAEGLVEDGSYRVIDRKRIAQILAEQNFNASDRVDPGAKSAKLGKVIGVKYLISGTITKFGTEKKGTSVGGGAFGGGKIGLGSVGTSSGKATVAVSTHVIDTSTAEDMVVAKGEGTSKRSGLMLSGGGGGSKGGAGSLAFGASDFKDTIIGEATEAAVKQIVAKLIAQIDKLR